MTDISSLFPLEATLTQEMIHASRPWSPTLCQGAILLRYALGDWASGREIHWWYINGKIDGISITTKEKVDFPSQEQPIKVTFIVAE